MSRIAQPATRSLNEPLGAGREQRRRSPDGCMLAFVRAPKSQLPGRGQIYLKMLPDGEPKRLTQDDLPKMSPRCFRRTARAIQTFTQRHLALSETHTFRPTLINEFRFGYYNHINPANDVDGVDPALGLTGTNPIDPKTVGIQPINNVLGLPGISVTGLLGYGYTGNDYKDQIADFVFNDTLSHIRRHHLFRYGAEIRYAQEQSAGVPWDIDLWRQK